MSDQITLPKLRCNQCGHRWTPRIADVRVCAKCHSVRWDKPRRKRVQQAQREE